MITYYLIHNISKFCGTLRHFGKTINDTALKILMHPYKIYIQYEDYSCCENDNRFNLKKYLNFVQTGLGQFQETVNPTTSRVGLCGFNVGLEQR